MQTGLTRTVEVDARALEHELHSVIHGEVRFSAGDRGLYSSDASNYRQVPIGVVIPRDKEDVILTVAACRRLAACPVTTCLNCCPKTDSTWRARWPARNARSR